MVVVGDDCALPHRGLGLAGRRGLAGTLFVHKVAGAAAAAGASLAQVAVEARAAAAAVGTVGVALKTCASYCSRAVG
jgi:dihydroxyacetone kinase